MPTYALINVTAPDAYNAASTLDNLPVCNQVVIQLVNQAVYYQIREVADHATLTRDLPDWSDERFLAPSVAMLSSRRFRGIRFRAAVKAANVPAGSSQAIIQQAEAHPEA